MGKRSQTYRHGCGHVLAPPPLPPLSEWSPGEMPQRCPNRFLCLGSCTPEPHSSLNNLVICNSDIIHLENLKYWNKESR